MMPIPAIAEVQVALEQAVAKVTGGGDALKRRLRTGTVVTNDDRNWELRWSKSAGSSTVRARSRSTWRSATVADPGLSACASRTARCSACPTSRCTARSSCPAPPTPSTSGAIGEHLQIGLTAIHLLQSIDASLHSRKLRSFDEPPFR